MRLVGSTAAHPRPLAPLSINREQLSWGRWSWGPAPSPPASAAWTSQEIVPGTRDGIVTKLRDQGLVFTLHRDVPLYVSAAVGRCVARALREAETGGGAPAPELLNLNEVFWVVHAGGREILDRVQRELGLREGKLAASRSAMRQYGNTRSSCVIMVMEEMPRRWSEEQGMRTAGEGLEWGILLGFGPGITVETILLRAMPNYTRKCMD